jgi:transposase
MVQGKEKTMLEKREILVQLRKGYSIRKVSRNLGMHRGVIRLIQKEAHAHGWISPDSHMPDNSEIERVLGNKPAQAIHPLDLCADDIKQWRVEGINAVVIRRLLKEKHQCNCHISTLRRYINKLCPKMPDPVMVRTAIPGEVMDVDFGFLGKLWDDEQGKFRKAWVFSGRLRYSRKAYRRIVWEQDVKTFLRCHILAFEHFNGVVETVCLDNLKAGVIKSSIDNDLLNRAYKELAEYYCFIISPCLPYTPEHKGGCENDIKYIKGNFWPQIREKQKTHPKLTLKEAQEDLDKWDQEVADVRKIRVMGRSPCEIFLEEKNALKALPKARFEPAEWFQSIVRKEWWIIHTGSYYSVPYELIGKMVQVRVTTDFLKIFFEHNEVANHPRAKVKGTYQRNPNHAPPYKEEVLNCNRQGLLHRSAELGDQVHKFCQKVLLDKYVDKLRAIRLLLRLAEKYSAQRLNKACERALAFGLLQYNSVKNILERDLDKEIIVLPSTSSPASFKHARNPLEYRTQEDLEGSDDESRRKNYG